MVGKRVVLLIFVATLSILLLGLPGQGSKSIQSAWFDTGADTQLTCDYGSCTGANPYAPGETADFSSSFNIASPGLNYDYMLISFMPPDFEIAHSSDIPQGSKVGELDADSTIAILNQNCNGATPVHFDLYSATTDTSDTFSLYPGNENGWLDDCHVGNGLPNLVDCYPTFLNRLFDPDGEDPKAPMVPRSRSVGQTNVAGSEVVIQFVQFNPGQLSGADGFAPPHNWSQFTTEWGYPSIIVLQQPGAPAVPISITSFCTPLASTTNLFGVVQAGLGGTTGGEVRQTNPAAGTGVAKSDGTGTNTHLYLSYSRSYRNADGDELESEIDTCPYVTNQDDFRVTAGADGDLIDPACDGALPNTADPDGDDFASGQDNCPQTYNQRDNCLLVSNPPEDCDDNPATPDEQCDADFDYIGDDCDVNPAADFDPDGDTVANRDDNCPLPGQSNTDQADTDGDGIGDICDPDFGNPNPPYYNVDPDGDTVPAIHIYDSENAPAPYVLDRADGGPKSDGIGDACDNDDDTADGYYMATFGITPICIGDPVQDNDGDGWCNDTEDHLGSDKDFAGSGDHDGDGTANAADNCPITYNPSQADTGGIAGIGDACELPYASKIAGDYDGDTLADGADPCPQAYTTPYAPGADADSDNIGDICDPMPGLDWSPFGRPEHHALEFAMPLHDAGAQPPMDERTGMDGMQQVCDDGIDNDGDTFTDGDDGGCNVAAPIDPTLPSTIDPPSDPGLTQKEIKCIRIDHLQSADGTDHGGWFQVGPVNVDQPFDCDLVGPAPIPALPNPAFIANLGTDDLDWSEFDIGIDKTVTLAGVVGATGTACLVGTDANPPGAGPAVVGPLNEYEPEGYSTQPTAMLAQLRFSIGLPAGKRACDYRLTVQKVAKVGYGPLDPTTVTEHVEGMVCDDRDGDGIFTDCPGYANDYCYADRNQTQTDTDGDGAGDVCDPDDDSDADTPTTPDAQEWLDGTDPLFDNTDDVAVTTVYDSNEDTDFDGGMDWEERWSSTDPWDRCGDDCGGTKTYDAWGYDINRDCWANSTDDLMYPANINVFGATMPVKLGNVGTGAAPSYLARYDLNGDNWVNATDRLMFPARILAISGGTMPYQCTQ